jgi:hypothetical protein
MAVITAGGSAVQGSTANTIYIELRNSADNTEAVSKVAANITAIRYARPLQAVVSVSPTNLAGVTSAHTDGGWIALDNTNMPGQYRLDLPNTAFAIGAPMVLITVQVAGCWLAVREIPLTTAALPWTFDSALQNVIGDAVLLRDWVAISATVPARCLLNAGRFLRNAWSITPGSPPILNVAKEDDNTALPAWQSSLTENAGATPITGSDPS